LAALRIKMSVYPISRGYCNIIMNISNDIKRNR
jgi:hypothetical protein